MVIKINSKLRTYQEEILETCKYKDCLVVLPTGLGKTKIGIALAAYRLGKIANSKILMCSPTKPLSAQIYKEFKEEINIKKNLISLLTGQIPPEKRKEIYKNSSIITATPQTIQKDLLNNRFSFKNFSCLIIDESHRAIGNYAYTFLAEKYIQESEFPRILALTASPGGTLEKIEEIKNNLKIQAVEIRTEQDIKEYIQEKKINWIQVDLPAPIKQLHEQIKQVYKTRLKDLKKLGITKPSSLISKRDLLEIQKQFHQEIKNKNPLAYHGVSLTSQLIKLDYALELLETQGLLSLQKFWEKLQTEETKAAKNIIKNPEITKAINLTSTLIEKNIKHPKMYMLKAIIKKELQQNPKSKIIVFANYRNTIDEIINFLKTIKEIKPVKLIGQKNGLKQKEQIQTIKDFEEGKYNTMISSSIGEEGISIKGALMAVLFDQGFSSEIRQIQRKGRVARLEAGKIIFLLTKNTREMAYYWSSYRKEKTMKKTLYNMQNKKEMQTHLKQNNRQLSIS